MDKCPVCQRPLESNLDVDLNSNQVTYRGKTFYIQPRQAEFLYAINEKHPYMVPHDELSLMIWGKNPPRLWDNQLTVYASRLRKIGEKHGFTVVCRRDEGYKLVLL